MKKGRAIRFILGHYAGKSGWIDEDKIPTESMFYVIVNLGTSLRATRVLKGSVGEEHKPPTTYAEAMFQQNPDIEVTLRKLCGQLAKCSILENDPEGLYRIVNKRLIEARERQDTLGSKGTYRRVQFQHKQD